MESYKVGFGTSYDLGMGIGFAILSVIGMYITYILIKNKWTNHLKNINYF